MGWQRPLNQHLLRAPSKMGQKYLLRLESIPRYVPKSSHSIPALSNLFNHRWNNNSKRQYETLSQLRTILSHSTLRLVYLQPTQNLDHMLTSILTIFYDILILLAISTSQLSPPTCYRTGKDERFIEKMNPVTRRKNLNRK